MFDGLNITTRVRGASQGITCQQPEHTDAAVMSETAKRATEPPFHDTRDVLQSRAIDGFRREGANPRIAFCGAEGLAYLELHSSACHLNASSA